MMIGSTHAVDRPQWAILGFTHGDGVAVIGSTDLTEAELRQETESWAEPQAWGLYSTRRYGATHITLTARMGQATIVYAATYEEALAKLFASWSPDSGRVDVAVLDRPGQPTLGGAVGPVPGLA